MQGSLSFYLLEVYITFSILLGVVFNQIPVIQNTHPRLAFLIGAGTQPSTQGLL